MKNWNKLINKSSDLGNDLGNDIQTTDSDTIKIALNILGAINAIFSSGTKEEREIIKKILAMAWEQP